MLDAVKPDLYYHALNAMLRRATIISRALN